MVLEGVANFFSVNFNPIDTNDILGFINIYCQERNIKNALGL